jgi:hypothetical protein
MSIYTYKTQAFLCELLNTEYFEDPSLSDQELNNIPEDADATANEASKRMLDIARLTANNDKRARNISIAKTGKKYGKEYSEVRKVSCKNLHKGEQNPMFGKKHSKGNLEKMKLSSKDRRWYNNGIDEIFIKNIDAPEGYILGRLYRKRVRV